MIVSATRSASRLAEPRANLRLVLPEPGVTPPPAEPLPRSVTIPAKSPGNSCENPASRGMIVCSRSAAANNLPGGAVRWKSSVPALVVAVHSGEGVGRFADCRCRPDGGRSPVGLRGPVDNHRLSDQRISGRRHSVTITGTAFGSGATEVYFGFDITSADPYGVQATEVSSAGTAIVVHAPVFELTSNPTVSITVIATSGTAITEANVYTYSVHHPDGDRGHDGRLPAGRPDRRRHGGHRGGHAVQLGQLGPLRGRRGTNVIENSPDSLSVTAPAGTPVTQDITVTSPKGTSGTSSVDQFTYNSTLAMANGTGSYGTGTSTSSNSTSQPPNDVFNVLSLMTGGRLVDPTTFTVVSQPASDYYLQLQLLGVHPGPDRRRLREQLDLRRDDDRHPDRDDRHL